MENALLDLLSSPATPPQTTTTTTTYPPPSEKDHSAPMLLTLILLLFFLVGFFSLYLGRCILACPCFRSFLQPRGNTDSTQRSAAAAPRGLDPSILATFPIFAYSVVKAQRIRKNTLECAVCICEFDDDDVIRLLPACNHAFHQECIDIWLSSHTTCPVCRSNLEELQQSQLNIPVEGNTDTVSRQLSFKESEGGGDGSEDGSRVPPVEEVSNRLTRSHSTGHSLVVMVSCDGGDDDRFTLRLPENVKDRIARDRNLTGSCVPFGNWGSGEGDTSIPMAGKSEGSTGSTVLPLFLRGAVGPEEGGAEECGRDEREGTRHLVTSV